MGPFLGSYVLFERRFSPRIFGPYSLPGPARFTFTDPTDRLRFPSPYTRTTLRTVHPGLRGNLQYEVPSSVPQEVGCP